jgi:hypothetical protein
MIFIFFNLMQTKNQSEYLDMNVQQMIIFTLQNTTLQDIFPHFNKILNIKKLHYLSIFFFFKNIYSFLISLLY